MWKLSAYLIAIVMWAGLIWLTVLTKGVILLLFGLLAAVMIFNEIEWARHTPPDQEGSRDVVPCA